MSQKTGKTITSKISAPISNHRNQSIRKGTLCNVLCLASFSENKGRGITATTKSSVGEIVPFIVEPSLSPTMKWLRQKCSQARSHFKVLFLRSHSPTRCLVGFLKALPTGDGMRMRLPRAKLWISAGSNIAGKIRNSKSEPPNRVRNKCLVVFRHLNVERLHILPLSAIIRHSFRSKHNTAVVFKEVLRRNPTINREKVDASCI